MKQLRLRQLFISPLCPLPTPEDRRLAALTTTFLLIMMLAVYIERFLGGNIPGIVLGFLGIAYLLSRTQWHKLAALILICTLAVPSLGRTFTFDAPDPNHILAIGCWLIIPILISSLLYSTRSTTIVSLSIGAALAILPILQPRLSFITLSGSLGFVITIATLVLIVMYQRNRIEEDRQSQLLQNQLRLQAEIAERQRIEAQLRASEEKYRLISRMSSDYTFASELDAQGSMQLSWVAGAFEVITGYTFQEYLAVGGWNARLHPDDVVIDTRDFAILKSNQDIVTDIRTLTKGNSVRWVRVYAHPVWDTERDQFVGIIGAVQDITQQKQAAADREALITELEHKNAELERFTYTVSHDLKSPLITIGGFLGFLERDVRTGNSERLQSDITRIRDATQKMHLLLDDLLKLSRIGRIANPPETIPFSMLVQEALIIVAGQLQKHGVAVEVAADLPLVVGDRIRLVEVLQNLLDNAAKFMGNQPAPHIQIGVRNAADTPIFYVADNGIGVDPHYHQKIFGLFERLETTSEGTGIGLALVKRIIEVHGGHIWIESEGEGKGSMICFTLGEAQPMVH